MTSPEKIEELLQNFGQTLNDLPKLKAGNIAVYDRNKRAEILKVAKKWHGRKDSNFYEIEDFACHQFDVIERLVKALETAIDDIKGMEK